MAGIIWPRVIVIASPMLTEVWFALKLIELSVGVTVTEGTDVIVSASVPPGVQFSVPAPTPSHTCKSMFMVNGLPAVHVFCRDRSARGVGVRPRRELAGEM